MLRSESKLGTTIGFVFPDKLIFLTTDRLELGEYVIVSDEIEGVSRPILGRIEDLVFSDFQTATRAATTPTAVIDALEREFTGQFSMKMFLVAQCQVLGVVNEEYSLVRLRTPIRPGLSVEKAPTDILQRALSPKPRSPLKIGTLSRRPDVEVFLDADTISQHAFITGVTGTGKTKLAMQIAQEASRLGFVVVVLALHDEWENLKKLEHVSYVDFRVQKLDFISLGLDGLCDLISANSFEREILANLFTRRAHRFDSPREVLKELAALSDGGAAVVRLLYEKLERLEDATLFGSPSISIRDLLTHSQISILSSTGPASETQFVLQHLLRELTLAKSQEALSRLSGMLFILDDFRPLLHHELENKFLETFSQARKLDLGFCIVAQSPSSVPRSILSLVGNFFVFRQTSEKHLALLGIGESFSPDIVKRLEQREMAASGLSFRLPLLVQVASPSI